MKFNRVDIPIQKSLRSLALVAAALTLGACGVFQPKAADEMKTADVTLNSSWHARIASPSELAGAVQMNGSASMAPGVKRGTTEVVMKLGNTSPGGVHPWAIHLGQCGEDRGVFGAPEDYPPLRVGVDGTGSSRAIVALDTPRGGDYFVSVQASPGNQELTVACGNLAAPTT
jgi:ABC-type phosphate transport system substrate-binding protein